MAVATNAKAKKDLLELLVKRFETDARVNNMYVLWSAQHNTNAVNTDTQAITSSNARMC